MKNFVTAANHGYGIGSVVEVLCTFGLTSILLIPYRIYALQYLHSKFFLDLLLENNKPEEENQDS